MIHDRNIICFASNWFYDPTSKHHVMRLLSERNHIIWVNYHASRRPRLTGADAGAVVGKLRQIVQGPRRVSEDITVVTPLVVPLPGNRAVTSLNRHLLTRQIQRVLKRLPDRPVQLWSFAPDVDYLCGRFGEERVVYYCVDEFSEFEGYDAAEVLAAERRLAEQADLVITTSLALFESKRHLNDNVALVRHGVDYDHFARATESDVRVPEDIAELPHPVLGFWGLIQHWIDVETLAVIARARPGWSLVLIGEALTDVSALATLPNVHLLGRRPYETLPAYARGFDVGLLPFKLDALTLAVNPIKLREYLSAGLPVVSTALPEAEAYREFVCVVRGGSVAERADGFIRACEAALKTRTPEQVAARQAAMRQETWGAKIEEISGLLESVRREDAVN